MNKPDHYDEAERLLKLANATYLEDSDEAGSPDEYATWAEFVRAVDLAAEVHDQHLRTASLYAQMATAHATLALADQTRPARPSVRGGDPIGHEHELGYREEQNDRD